MTWLIGIFAVAYLAFVEVGRSSILINAHSFYLVVGGTALVVLLMTPVPVIQDIIDLCIRSFKRNRSISQKDLNKLIKDQNSYKDSYGLIEQAQNLWEVGVSNEEFERLLHYRAESIMNKNLAAIATLRNLGKYPPSLGMIGTVLGMISLFSGLNGENQSSIGAELALAMTATLYGLTLANLIILPMADRLEASEEIRRSNLENLLKVLVSINLDQPSTISENLVNVA
jgi:chemotaxis protein MotA